MYIYSISIKLPKMAWYPTVILWGSYGYPTVFEGLLYDFR